MSKHLGTDPAGAEDVIKYFNFKPDVVQFYFSTFKITNFNIIHNYVTSNSSFKFLQKIWVSMFSC